MNDNFKKSNLEFFSNSYPKTTITSLEENDPPSSECIKEPSKSKKFFTVLLIVIVAALMYSSIAYTISEMLSVKLGVTWFDSTGQPNSKIIAIHSIVFMIFVYIILGVMKNGVAFVRRRF